MERGKPRSWWGLTQKEHLLETVSIPTWRSGVVQAIVPVRTLDRQILPPTTAEARGAGCDLLRLSVSEHKLYRPAATGAECSNNENTNKHLTRNFHEAVKHLWNLDSVVDATIIQISFSSSLSISFRIEEIAHCSWHQLGQAHDKYSGQPCVFAPERHWLDAGRLGTRSWPVEGLNRIILIAVFEGQQQHRAINYPSIYPAQAQAGQSWFGLKLITTCASVTCDRPAVNGPG